MSHEPRRAGESGGVTCPGCPTGFLALLGSDCETPPVLSCSARCAAATSDCQIYVRMTLRVYLAALRRYRRAEDDRFGHSTNYPSISGTAAHSNHYIDRLPWFDPIVVCRPAAMRRTAPDI
ncbi:hypothetical protein Bbelb_397170 [Branchiostoma belcheri]|nr:hypothetical protein Bbelb_397170 [Branchiostoma belcheri]